jgi:hypothetical protein
VTKTRKQIIFFLPPKSQYFFQQHWESEYFFRKKNNLPPFKLNGRSLSIFNLFLEHLARFWNIHETNDVHCFSLPEFVDPL